MDIFESTNFTHTVIKLKKNEASKSLKILTEKLSECILFRSLIYKKIIILRI